MIGEKKDGNGKKEETEEKQKKKDSKRNLNLRGENE